MKFILIYQEKDFAFIEKNNLSDIFSLPGNYYVFEEKPMIKQYGHFYKDPFIYYKSKDEITRLKINQLELLDTEIQYTYNSNFFIAFTLYDFITSKSYKISKSDLNHTKALPLALSFLIKTMTEHPSSRDWRYYELEQENIKLKAEVERLKLRINEQRR